MGRRSWIHFINSRESARNLEKFINEEGNDYFIAIVGAALISGEIKTYNGYFGDKDTPSLTLLTESDGDLAIKEMSNRRVFDFSFTVLLGDLDEDETEPGEHGTKIKKAKYLTIDEYRNEVKKLPESMYFEKSDSIITIFEKSGFIRFDYDEHGWKIYPRDNIDDLNIFGETQYVQNEYENLRKGLKEIFKLSGLPEPYFGYFDSVEINSINEKIRLLIDQEKIEKIPELLDSISNVTSKIYENNQKITRSNTYLKFRTLRVDMNSYHPPFFITPDEKYMVYGASDNKIKAVELKSGKIIEKFTGLEKGYTIEAITPSPDGKYFAICASNYKNYFSYGDTILIWNYETEELITEIKDPSRHSTDYINRISIPSGNKYLISGVNSIRIWDFNTGDLIRQIKKPHKDKIKTLQSSKNGKYVITGSRDTTAKTWEIETGELVHTFSGHKRGVISGLISGIVNNVSFSPDEKYIISNSSDNTIKVWEFLKGNVVKDIPVNFLKTTAYSSQISPDGNQIIAYLSFGRYDLPSFVMIWDFHTTKLLQTLAWKNGEGWGTVNDIKISPKGNYLISYSYDHNRNSKFFGGMINICVSLDYYSKMINDGNLS